MGLLLYYKGMSLSEIDQMPIDEAHSFYEFAEKKEAADNLLKLNMADYPNMKGEDRKKLFQSLREIAYPISEQKLQNTEDLARFLNG